MPRLSLWNQNKGYDYNFFNNIIREQFHVGGTSAIIHKYLGPKENLGEKTETEKTKSRIRRIDYPRFIVS